VTLRFPAMFRIRIRPGSISGRHQTTELLTFFSGLRSYIPLLINSLVQGLPWAVEKLFSWSRNSLLL